ncbi:MAG: hypothetical protein JNK85_07215 [Verrucomicrobiales bacterium]|nr:hypothetical protein [Verrucomicrobiales bacterium]
MNGLTALVGGDHRFGDALGQLAGVGLGGFGRAAISVVAAPFTVEDRCGMGVRGGDEDVVFGDVSAFLDATAGGFDDPARHGDKVADDDRRALGAIVDHERFGLEIVEDAFVAAGVIVPGQTDSGRGIDIDGGDAQPEFGAGRERGNEEAQEQQRGPPAARKVRHG